MNREQAINYLICRGFTNEQVGEVVRALTYEPARLSVDEVTALAEWTEKLTKECEEAYNKGFKDGIKGSIIKADYENRLKADMVAMLEELYMEIEELDTPSDDDSYDAGIVDCEKLIQEKINSLKEAKDGENNN